MPAHLERPKILIIEDDSKLASALVTGIQAEGYDANSASSAEEGLQKLLGAKPDLLLLDITLPEQSGLDLLRRIRKDRIDVRVLMLTSHNTVDDRVEGLNSGADDYLGKPFSFPELMARIQALLRRILPPSYSNILDIDDLSLDIRSRSAKRAGKALELSPREYDLLQYLAEHKEQTVSREMLTRDVWKENARYTPLDNVIDVQMNRLRHKVDDGHSLKLLHTVRGLGFILKGKDL